MKFITELFSKKKVSNPEIRGASLRQHPSGIEGDDRKLITLTQPYNGKKLELRRKEVYLELPIQILLRNLLEDKNEEILPTYDPLFGFRYTAVESAINEDNPTEAEAILERLYNLEILEKTFFETVSSCPNCASTSVTLHYRCPTCSSYHIDKTSLTEHIPCGNIDERDNYTRAGSEPTCPKCGEPLVEGEYRDVGRWYVCRECKEKFENPDLNIVCRRCNNKFSLQDANILEISKYNLNLSLEHEIRQNVTSLESVNKLLIELGFAVEMPAMVFGEKSGIQHYFSLIAKKKASDTDVVITIDHAVGDSEVSATQLILYVYKISEVNVDVPIFVAIPKLNETAKKIAQGHNILVIEGIPQHQTQLATLKAEIQRRLMESPIEPPARALGHIAQY